MIRITLLALFLTPLAVAQGPIPDTISADRYAPLAVGNEWHYRERGGPPEFNLIYLHVWSVPADSLIDGEQCFLFERRRYTPAGHPTPDHHLFSDYLRFDEEAGNLRSCTDVWLGLPWQYLPECPLSLDFGGKFQCSVNENIWVWVDYPESTVTIGSEAVQTTVKKMDTGALETYHHFAADIGLTLYGYWMHDTYLVYARIGENEYGNPVHVSNEPESEIASSLTLTVFPNPASTSATATFTLDTSQEVTLELFDLLGRRVWQRELGILSLGEHQSMLDLRNLPAGLYIVRLSGNSGMSATVRLTRLEGQ